jgi:SAM-dependent methyltransferase
MMRRRRSAILARGVWAGSPIGRLVNSQTFLAALTPRADRIVELLGLARGKRYVDIGCGTAAYAHLLASRARLHVAPVTLDIASPSSAEALAWPEQLPLGDASVDCLTSFYFARRFDDEVLHRFAQEIRRVLAPGGRALVIEVAPVRWAALDRLHRRMLAGGCATVDLRGWGRMAALFTECEFDAIDLVSVGPFLFPPIPRVGVLLRRA